MITEGFGCTDSRRKRGARSDHIRPKASQPTPGTAEIWRLENDGGDWDQSIHIHFEECQTIARNGSASNVEEWMTADPSTHGPVKSYAEAPRPRPVPGENLFRTRCAACHTVGKGEGLGPDLAGVTARRDRRWLARWLANPEQVLDEKDPLALELLERHGNLAMPGLTLADAEVSDLLSYIEALSAASGAHAQRAR